MASCMRMSAAICSEMINLRLLTGVLDLRRRGGLRETRRLPRLLLRDREEDRLIITWQGQGYHIATVSYALSQCW